MNIVLMILFAFALIFAVINTINVVRGKVVDKVTTVAYFLIVVLSIMETFLKYAIKVVGG